MSGRRYAPGSKPSSAMAVSPLPVTEEDVQRVIVETAQWKGWLVHHLRPARTKKGWRTAIIGDPGFPDLVLARPGRITFFIECKGPRGRFEAGQRAWRSALEHGGGQYILATPANLDTVLALL
jgi:hypothetical protein